MSQRLGQHLPTPAGRDSSIVLQEDSCLLGSEEVSIGVVKHLGGGLADHRAQGPVRQQEPAVGVLDVDHDVRVLENPVKHPPGRSVGRLGDLTCRDLQRQCLSLAPVLQLGHDLACQDRQLTQLLPVQLAGMVSMTHKVPSARPSGVIRGAPA